jgi:hydrogenase maturation protease
MAPGRGVLVVGYGNRLRSDDGLGWHVIERLTRDPRVAGAELLWRHQLTPELAVDFAAASLVVLVDAAADMAPGVISVRQIGPSASGGTVMSHHTDPQSLVMLAVELYGVVPPVYVVGVGPLSLEEGDRLSPVVEAAMPRILDAVVEIAARAARLPRT